MIWLYITVVNAFAAGWLARGLGPAWERYQSARRAVRQAERAVWVAEQRLQRALRGSR